MSDPFIGEIRLFPYTFAPYGWAYCNGQALNTAQYQALAVIVGTLYGQTQTPTTSFLLPNLQGQAAIGAGTGTGLSTRAIGSHVGEDGVTLSTTTIPPHTHTLQGTYANGSDLPGTTPSATSRVTIMNNYIQNPQGDAIPGYNQSNPVNTTLNSGALGVTGSGGAHENRQPYLAVPFCIALDGVFPMRP